MMSMLLTTTKGEKGKNVGSPTSDKLGFNMQQFNGGMTTQHYVLLL